MTGQQPYLVSARKYRPSTFSSVVGQRALTATLKNSISSGRLAQAYLFCGPRGVGKTSCARIFAKTINCLSPSADGEACGVCESCKAVDMGNSFNLVELDAASNNSVDDIRSITEQVYIPPQVGKYRVFIIDEVHMLSNSAFNAFLKTLEEPPKNVIFILATTERHKVIPTILSRCQVYDFRRITVNDMVDHLADVARAEGVEAERDALGVIALQADGAMRDALSIFDQVSASTRGKITYEGTIEALNVLDKEYYFRMLDLFRENKVAESLLTLQEITDKGFDPQVFINGLANHVRNLMVASDPKTLKLLETSSEMEQRYLEQAGLFAPEWYYNALKILNDCDYQYKTTGNKRLLVELALIRLCRLLRRESENQTATAPVTPSAATSTPPFAKPTETRPQVRPEIKNEVKSRHQEQQAPRSFRLSEISPAVAPRSEIEKKNEKYADKDLEAAWVEYATSHPEQRILVSAMRNFIPQKIGEHRYLVKAQHPAQKQAYESEIGGILQFLHEKLNNDNITLQIELTETEDVKKLMNPKDLLKKAVDSNPALGQFLSAIEAELE